MADFAYFVQFFLACSLTANTPFMYNMILYIFYMICILQVHS